VRERFVNLKFTIQISLVLYFENMQLTFSFMLRDNCTVNIVTDELVAVDSAEHVGVNCCSGYFVHV